MNNGIRVERDGGIGRLILARPERQNVVDRAMADALFGGLEELEADASVRLIHLTGEGDDFCAGPDLEAMAALADASPEVRREDAEAVARIFLAIRAMMKPVVCSVRGRALSIGVGLALASDVAVAHADAEFGFPESRIGFVASLPMALLRRAVGEKAAADLVLTGRVINAEEAERVGLVSRVLTSATYDEEVEGLLQGLLRLSPTSLALSKWLLHKLDGLSFDDGIAAGVVTNVEARDTDDFKATLRRLGGSGS